MVNIQGGFALNKIVKAPLLLVLSLVLVLTACSSGNNNAGNNASKNQGSNSSSNSASSNDQQPAAPEETPEVTVFFSDHNLAMPTGNLSELEVIKYMTDKLNIKINFVPITHSGYAEQLKLKFASGDIPDWYQTWGIANDETVANDRALPLNDLLEQYGQNLLERIPQTAWDAVTVQGKIMAIPQPTAAAANKMIFMRKDWLDKVGLQVPTTSDELLNVLRAFRDGDPNENGQKDEIPFSMRENLSWGENLFGMFGINPDTNMVVDGEVIPGIIHPNMKNALAFFRTMYEEKLLDMEFLTNSSQIWTQKINSDLAGTWTHNSQNGYHWRLQHQEFLPGKQTEIVAIPTPQGVGYDGEVGVKFTSVNKSYVIFNDAKNPEAIIKLYDWLISDEGQIWAGLGLEGKTYTKNGDVLTYDRDADEALGWNWRIAPLGVYGFSEFVEKAKNDEAGYGAMKQGIDLALQEGISNPTEAMPAPQGYNDNPDLRFNGTLWLEAATLIILGDKPLDYFDEFVEQWRAQGGNQVIAQMTEWYNANK